MYQRALVAGEKVLSPLHPQTLNAMSKFALSLQKLGRYEEAEQMARQTLKGREGR
jgi:hypothetical protein